MSIEEAEIWLSETNCKTLDPLEFMEYARRMISFEMAFGYFFLQPFHRKYQWKKFLKRRKFLDNFIRSKFMPMFGGPEDTLVAIGDWVPNQHLRGSPSVPKCEFEEALEHAEYLVVIVSEKYTSQVCPKCDTRNQRLKMTKVFNERTNRFERRPIWKAKECLDYLTVWNRDRMASRNIHTVAFAEFHGLPRPAVFT